MKVEPDIEELLARLADGSLPDAEAARLRVRIEESPELQARLRAQQRAVGLVQMTAGIAAPASVHAAVAERIAPRPRRRAVPTERWAWRPRVLAPLAVGVAAAIVVVVVLVSGGSRSLTVGRTTRLALATPTRGAPRVDPTDSDLLSLRVDSIAFPAYESRSDWRATGARTDEIDARRVQTVFYDISGRRVGYSIVPGAALHVPSGQPHTIDGVTYVTADNGSGHLVTWRRDGHTCVIAGAQVGTPTLLRLAAATSVTT